VVDVGCGTGLNLGLLAERVGVAGRVVAVDLSRPMLDRAEAKVRRHGWTGVRLHHGDATTMDPAEIERLAGGPVDAVLATYALSLMPGWPRAWRRMLATARPGARLAVVDMRTPLGRARPLSPVARLACALGGADIAAHPWQGVERDTREVRSWSLCGGHVQVRSGTLAAHPGPAQPAGTTRAWPT
jgi:S-adenosylmethionine-diacylgycerolhomoserine-N-methlytransferase